MKNKCIFKENISEFQSDAFAVSKANRIITRQFTLIPSDINNIATIYSQFDKFFIDLVNLQNRLLHKMHDNLSNGILSIADFAYTNISFIKSHIYDKLEFNRERGEYKERIVRCATDSPYQAYRNWLIRNHNLSTISEQLSKTFSTFSKNMFKIFSNFMCNTPLPYDYLDYLFKSLSKNIFGEIQINSLSNFFISNMIKQLRNILFFKFNNEIEGYLKICLENIRKDSSHKLDNYILFCLSDFNRRVKKERVKVPIEELSCYFLDNYFLTLKRINTKYTKKKLLKSKTITSTKLKSYLNQSKKERNAVYEKTKENILNSLNKIDLKNIISVAFEKLFNHIDTNSNLSVSKFVFNPSFLSVRFKEPSFEDFINYIRIKFENKLRERFRDLFISPELINIVINGLKRLLIQIQKSETNTVKLPEIKSGSLSINDLSVIFSREEEKNNQFYSQLIASKKFQLSLLPKEFIEFDIGNKRDYRILKISEKYKSRIVRICLPIVTYKNRKLILHLPFEVERKDKLAQSIDKNEEIVLGLDLGLKHFGVISVEDKRTNIPKEIARYFIGQKELFDMKFVDNKFVQRSRFKNVKYKQHITNIKRHLINIRKEIQDIQSRQANRVNELKKNGILNYKLDSEYKNFENKLSLLWKRVRNINLEIIRLLSHDIIEIAKYHHVDTIKVEDLRFSTYRKRKDIGRFISFWQIHWLFSSIQDAIELQAYLNNIEFKRVNARYTSQKCSICGELGDRDGKAFYCGGLDSKTKKHVHKPIQLDADLNAARNIAWAST